MVKTVEIYLFTKTNGNDTMESFAQGKVVTISKNVII